jgi:hypothetical protein
LGPPLPIRARIVTVCGRAWPAGVCANAGRAHLRLGGSATLWSAAAIEYCGMRVHERRGTGGRGYGNIWAGNPRRRRIY